MKYVKVTAYVDGEAISEPNVPLFCLDSCAGSAACWVQRSAFRK